MLEVKVGEVEKIIKKRLRKKYPEFFRNKTSARWMEGYGRVFVFKNRFCVGYDFDAYEKHWRIAVSKKMRRQGKAILWSRTHFFIGKKRLDAKKLIRLYFKLCKDPKLKKVYLRLNPKAASLFAYSPSEF